MKHIQLEPILITFTIVTLKNEKKMSALHCKFVHLVLLVVLWSSTANWVFRFILLNTGASKVCHQVASNIPVFTFNTVIYRQNLQFGVKSNNLFLGKTDYSNTDFTLKSEILKILNFTQNYFRCMWCESPWTYNQCEMCSVFFKLNSILFGLELSEQQSLNLQVVFYTGLL